MNVFLCEQYCPCLFIVLANVVVFTKGLDHGSGSEVNYFSGEFESFLHGLGSMVYKYKKPSRQALEKVSNGHVSDYADTTVPATKAYRRSENMLRTQKEVLKDVLMMKLVSYYEDKYKIMHTDNPDQVTSPRTSAVTKAKNGRTYAEYDELSRSRTFDENPRNAERRNDNTKNRQRFRNTVMQRDMEEVIVI